MSHILVVEDNEMNSEILSRRLKKRGFEVTVAVNGEEAVNLVGQNKYDLILMDMRMPVMSGWDATKKIKSNPLTKIIPIVGLSAHAMEEDRAAAIEAGCDEYDTKPINFERLSQIIDKLLSK